MVNPMLQMLNQSKPLNSQTNLISMLENANNPQELIQNMVAQNPQVNALIRQYGNGDPKAAFYEYARQSGQDPDQVLNILKKIAK